ncbi:hypothetical protein A0J61_02337 [Choanephora cucurbitarum]|uniref:Uncharacterized protein n=1 Tax=Choanephora cucurbitarum TaxID=101091 RepID=A0A1C7NKH0_9FUNG|nr:hypothetical protein A0J61_02337 [Choanephora cucurbitarum]
MFNARIRNASTYRFREKEDTFCHWPQIILRLKYLMTTKPHLVNEEIRDKMPVLSSNFIQPQQDVIANAENNKTQVSNNTNGLVRRCLEYMRYYTTLNGDTAVLIVSKSAS